MVAVCGRGDSVSGSVWGLEVAVAVGVCMHLCTLLFLGAVHTHLSLVLISNTLGKRSAGRNMFGDGCAYVEE